MFAFELGGDFHEAPESPTINAGINDVSNGSADIDGQDRTIDTTTDIGADELGLPTTTALACSPTALTAAGHVDVQGDGDRLDGLAGGTDRPGRLRERRIRDLLVFDLHACAVRAYRPGQLRGSLLPPNVAGAHGLTAVSGQDTTHEGSKGATSLSATAPATPTTPATPISPAVKKKCKKKHKRAAAAKKKCKKHRVAATPH